MTPAEYMQLRKPIEEAIDRLRDAKLAMLKNANQSPLPANLRPATAYPYQVRLTTGLFFARNIMSIR